MTEAGGGRLALVLSGGGAKGAFQVGALQHLIEDRGLDFTIVAGVSTGALQAAMVAQGDMPALAHIWQAIRSSDDIYRKRFLGRLRAALGLTDSLFDDGPLRDKIRANIDPEKLRRAGRTLLVGTVSLQLTDLREVSGADTDLAEWILASASIPVLFPPQALDGVQWVDGGVREITPPLAPVMRCKPSGILVILAAPLEFIASAARFTTVIEIAKRGADIMSREIYRDDLDEAAWINDLRAKWDAALGRIDSEGLGSVQLDQCLHPLKELVEKYRVVPIHVMAPPRVFMGTLDFDPAKIAVAMAAGRRQAEEEWPKIRATLAL